MVSREHKRDDEDLHDKLQLLRSVTRSRAIDDASIVLDASNYIKELKQKVERLSEEITTAETGTSAHHHSPPTWPRVRVETLDKGFLVDVNSGRGCPGLLLPVLATLEDLGLHVLEARVSCLHAFHLQALGGDTKDDEEGGNYVNGQTVKRAICNTIKIWSESI